MNIHWILLFISIMTCSVGFALVLKIYNPSSKQSQIKTNLITGFAGVFLLFFAASIIIYLYSTQPPSSRIEESFKNGHSLIEELPEVSFFKKS